MGLAGVRRLGAGRVSIAIVVLAGASLPQVSASAENPAAERDWRSYVESPAQRHLSPVGIADVSGTVANPTALTHPSGDGLATLTYSPGGVPPVVVVDYGNEIGGVPVFDVAAVSGTPVLRAAYSETLAAMSNTGDMVNMTNAVGQRFDTLPVAEPGVIAGITIQGGERYELLTLLTPGRVTLRSVAIEFTGYLGTPDALRGYFLSNDDLVNRAWYAGVYTVNLDQVVPGTSPGPHGHDVNLRLLIDGAKRDRSVWSGDIALSEQTVFAALDPGYVRDSLRLLGDHPATVADYLVPAVGVQAVPGPLPGVCQPYSDDPTCLTYSVSYSTLFVPALHDYFQYTADEEFLRQEWPNVTRVLAWNATQLDRNGLLSTDSNNGRDWHGGGPALSGEVGWTNIIYYLALVDAATLASALDDPLLAAAYRQAASALQTAINSRLWNDKVGVFDISDTIRGGVAQDTNTFAITSGLATPAQATRIVAAITSQLASERGMHGYSEPVPAGLTQTISPFMGSYQLFADFMSGHAQDALDLVRREWGWQLDHDPGGTVWENIPETGALPGSESAAHAWGTGPTAALSRYVLGVAPTTPGFATMVVAPQPADLAWAEGAVPTPDGAVTVRWTEDHCRFDLHIDVPPDTIATAVIPGTKGVAETTVDGASLARSIAANDFVVPDLTSGRHDITAHQSNCSQP
jgi:hypothetical protein